MMNYVIGFSCLRQTCSSIVVQYMPYDKDRILL